MYMSNLNDIDETNDKTTIMAVLNDDDNDYDDDDYDEKDMDSLNDIYLSSQPIIMLLDIEILSKNM